MARDDRRPPAYSEGVKRSPLYQRGELDEDAQLRRRLCADWDAKHPSGEGETDLGLLYQWVRVVDDDGKVMGTFMLKSADGDCYAMFLTLPRKGLPPNPFDDSAVSGVPWVRADMDLAREGEQFAGRRHLSNAARPEDTRPHDGRGPAPLLHQYGVASAMHSYDLHYTQGVHKGVRVRPLVSNDGDTRFKFHAGTDGFTVRGSKLSRVLFQFRQAGVQRVGLGVLRAALQRLA